MLTTRVSNISEIKDSEHNISNQVRNIETRLIKEKTPRATSWTF